MYSLRFWSTFIFLDTYLLLPGHVRFPCFLIVTLIFDRKEARWRLYQNQESMQTLLRKTNFLNSSRLDNTYTNIALYSFGAEIPLTVNFHLSLADCFSSWHHSRGYDSPRKLWVISYKSTCGRSKRYHSAISLPTNSWQFYKTAKYWNIIAMKTVSSTC